MRSGWTASAAVALLALAACGGPGPDAVSSTSSPPPAGATTPNTSAPRTTAPSTDVLPTAPPPAPTPTTATRPPTAPSTTTAPRPTTPRPTSTTTLPAALRGVVLTTLPTSSRVVALTFDGGAGSQGAAAILATLRAEKVPASFFVTGTFATANPTTTRSLAAVGPVGNHSWSHPDFTSLSASAIDGELVRTHAAIASTTGADPHPFFRFPYGAYDPRTLTLVNGEGYGAIGWTTDSLGWKGTSGGMSVDAVVARVLGGAAPGQIVLMHLGANPDDGTTLDADALPRIIAGYRAAGYGFVTLNLLRR